MSAILAADEEGGSLENPLYHVLLEGRRVGPYDRRTIVGMRIKKALTSQDVVVAGNGRELTVGELVKMDRPDNDFGASRSGSYSVVQAVHTAALVESAGSGFALPPFKGEVEVRVQTRALRLAGRFRSGLGWKEDRVKIPLQDLKHARARGSLVDLGLQPGDGAPLQRITLELFTPEGAAELMAGLPAVTPWPEGVDARRARLRALKDGAHPMVWTAIVGTAVAVGGVLVWVATR